MNTHISTKLGTLVLIIIAITAGAFVWKYEKAKEQDFSEIQNVVIPPKTVSENQEQNLNKTNWLIYSDEKNKLSFQYPNDVQIQKDQKIFKNHDETRFMFNDTKKENTILSITATTWKTRNLTYIKEDAGTFYEKIAFNRWNFFLKNKDLLNTGKCTPRVLEMLPESPTLQKQSSCNIQIHPKYIKVETDDQIIFYTSTSEVTISFNNTNYNIVSEVISSVMFD